uniref:Reverse transcriptase domain-containing protein n=1 Tax=Tanacetum cinerariifolium TaxID=118510 RepID=A0A699H328_TANCI|nr:hypothetical protein [Tanacetum cinerariifolium]
MPKVLTQAWDKFFEIQHAQPEDIHELLRKLIEDLQIINEELVEYINSSSWNRPAFYDDDDDEYSIQVSEFLKKSPIAITPVLQTEDPKNSLSMGDKYLSIILETKSDEVIKSSVEDLVPIPSESEGILDNMCDVPFSDKNHFDDESDLIKYLLTRDTLIVYSSKIDSLLEEFADELVHIDPIPSGINETDSDLKDEIRFIKNDSLPLLEFESFHFDLYDDPSSSRPSEKPPDDGGILTTKVVDDISDNSTLELDVHVLIVFPSLPTLYLSHWGFKVFQLVNNYESPMMIYGENIPRLDVPFFHFYPP